MYVLAVDDATDLPLLVDPTFFDMKLTADIVPEPATLGLMLLGGLALLRRKRST